MPRSKPKVTVEPVSKIVDTPPGPRQKPVIKPYTFTPKDKGLGGMAYSDRELGHLFTQPIGKKQENIRDTWANTAMVLGLRAKKASQTYSKKDFNALYRLVLAGSIAYDKAFPQQVQPLGGNLVIQLFGSLGSETARRILEPARPHIVDVTPTEPALVDTPSELVQTGEQLALFTDRDANISGTPS